MKKKHTFLIISLIFVAVAAALAVGAYIYYANQFRDRFFKGTVINGMDVSGMTADEVEHMIENNADRSYNLTVTFRDGKSETITADDIRYRYESDGSVQKLMDEQDPYAWVQAFLHPETRDVQVPMVYDEDLLEEKISSLPELQEENMTAPTDAYMDFQDTKFVIVPETEGTQLDAGKAAELIREAVASYETALDIEEAAPDIYTKPAVLSTDKKMNAEMTELNKYTGEKNYLSQGVDWQKSISKRMQELRQTLETQEPLDVFDRIVFESIVEKVIVGGYDSDGNPAPYNLTFVLKSDQSISTEYNRERYKAKQKETREGRVS